MWCALAVAFAIVFALYFARSKKSKAVPQYEPFSLATRELDSRSDSVSPGVAARLSKVKAESRATRTEDARWIRADELIEHQGFVLRGGHFYFGQQSAGRLADEPSVIDPRLQVVRGRDLSDEEGLSYWPAYARISPENRGAYLVWIEGGRCAPSVAIGYVFVYFYGLERRALEEKQDLPQIIREVERLHSIYGHNRSFESYASGLLAVLAAPNLATMTEVNACGSFEQRASENEVSMKVLLAWFQLHKKPLPGRIALSVAKEMKGAVRSVVAKRASSELFSLFETRYQAAFGDGLLLNAASRSEKLLYRPASAALLRNGDQYGVPIPNVMGLTKQFQPLVRIWNECIDDLKKFATAKAKAGAETGELTLKMWEAMPQELRNEHDHPMQAEWQALVERAPACGRGALTTFGELASVLSVEPRDRFTATQLRIVANTAATLGYAIEPDPRVVGGAFASDAAALIWQTRFVETPDERVYSPVSIVLRLALSVATADETVGEEEISVVTKAVEKTFALDPGMRERVDAIRLLFVSKPTKVTSLIRKLANLLQPEQTKAIGRLLVAVAAADHMISRAEHKALKGLYKGLGIAPAVLDNDLVAAGARLEDDEPILVSEGRAPSKGSPVTAPRDGRGAGVQLDRRAIEEILRDTSEVAALLATVLGVSDDENKSDESGISDEANRATVPAKQASEANLSRWDAATAVLAPPYIAVLNALVKQPQWSFAEVSKLTTQAQLMPSAVAETLNSWSDDVLGDHLIDDSGDWTVDTELVERFLA